MPARYLNIIHAFKFKMLKDGGMELPKCRNKEEAKEGYVAKQVMMVQE